MTRVTSDTNFRSYRTQSLPLMASQVDCFMGNNEDVTSGFLLHTIFYRRPSEIYQCFGSNLSCLPKPLPVQLHNKDTSTTSCKNENLMMLMTTLHLALPEQV